MIQLEGFNIIVPINRLRKCRPNIPDVNKFLDERTSSGDGCWRDEYLFREGAANADEVKLRLVQWTRSGLSTTRRHAGVEEWNDVCVVDSSAGPTLPCNWLECNLDRHTAWLAGTPGDENCSTETIVFLHGRESTPETSGSARAVVEYFAKDRVLVPDYRPLERSHAEIEEYLLAVLKEAGDGLTVVGISLGGYWAYRMASQAKNVSRCIMLNPSFRCYPEVPLVLAKPELPTTLVVNLDDDVVDPARALNLFAGRAAITSFSRGGHSFENRKQMLREIEIALRSETIPQREAVAFTPLYEECFGNSESM